MKTKQTTKSVVKKLPWDGVKKGPNAENLHISVFFKKGIFLSYQILMRPSSVVKVQGCNAQFTRLT